MQSDRAGAMAPGAAAPPLRRVPFLAACVGLPLVALGFELLTHGCLDVLFDPIPSWLHVLAVASVPACLLAADLAFWRGRPTRSAIAAAGFALGISLPYALLFLPVLPLAAFGVLWFGIGLLPFAPLAAAIGALRRGLGLARRHPRGRRIFWSSAAAAFAALALLEVPGWMTWRALQSESVPQLERWSSHAALRRAAWLGGESLNLTAHLVNGLSSFPDVRRDAQALARNRRLFHRVTGEDASASPPRLPGVPEPRLFAAAWSRGEGLARDLSLASSRLDLSAFADEGIAYFEWTLVFQNAAVFQQEATAQLLLPPGGVVTRANLWIDGEVREAAFGGRAQVREAYETVASTRRDPLLVTSDRPGEAAIRAFPIPPDGGTMQVRVGVTAPLELASRERAELVLPSFGARNFALPAAPVHAVWIDSRTPILSGTPGLAELPQSMDVHTAQAELTWTDAPIRVGFARDPQAAAFHAADGADGANGAPAVIRQRVEPAPDSDRRWIVVVDGSAGMARHRDWLVPALEALPAERLVGLAIAEDEPVWLLDAAQPDRAAALERLRRYEFRAGRDNQAALEAAWDRAHAGEQTAVVWLSGAQPMLLRQPQALIQRMERRPDLPIVAISLEPAGHALLDALPARANLAVVRAPAARAAVESMRGAGATRWTFARERLAGAPGVAARNGTDPVALALRRLWASDEVTRLLRRLAGEDARQAAAELATRYRVVTPVSGAVVLETAAQYAATDLPVPRGGEQTPLDAVVPEPGTGLLFGLGLALLAARRRRAR